MQLFPSLIYLLALIRMLRNLDYHLHPSVEHRLPPNARIADVGTGTGSYLIELSKALLKTYSFDGFDVSSTQFRKELPGNVALHVQDVRTDFPPEFHGKFDAVHLRLLVCGLDKNDWVVATQKLIPLLKPGGAIQWEEANWPEAQYLRSGGKHTSAEVFGKVATTCRKHMMHRFKWGYNLLPDIFRECGLVDVMMDRVSSDRLAETRRPLAVTVITGALGWAKKAQHWSEQDMDQLKEQADKEVAEGAYVRYDIWVAIGFKPLINGKDGFL